MKRSAGVRIFSVMLCVLLALGVSLPAGASARDSVTVSFYITGGEAGRLYKQVEVTLGTSLGSQMPSDPAQEGGTFTGWTTDRENPVVNFDRSTVVTSELSVHAVWAIDTRVEHYIYSGSVASAVLKDVDTVPTLSAGSIDVELRSYEGYVFDVENSSLTSVIVEGVPTIRLYYKKGSYQLGVKSPLDLEVRATGKITVAELAKAAEACTLDAAGEVLSLVEFKEITSPDLDKLDLTKATVGYTQTVTLQVVWENGDTGSKTIQIRVVERKLPQMTLGRRKIRVSAGSSMDGAALVRAFGVQCDGSASGIQASFLGNVDWSEPGDFVVYFTAPGGKARKAGVVSVA